MIRLILWLLLFALLSTPPEVGSTKWRNRKKNHPHFQLIASQIAKSITTNLNCALRTKSDLWRIGKGIGRFLEFQKRRSSRITPCTLHTRNNSQKLIGIQGTKKIIKRNKPSPLILIYAGSL